MRNRKRFIGVLLLGMVEATLLARSHATLASGADDQTTAVRAAEPAPTPRELPDEIDAELRGWRRSAALLQGVQVLLAVVAVISSILVAAQMKLSQTQIRWLAVLSAIATSMLSAFDPGGEANRFRNAWRVLNSAVVRFQNDQSVAVSTLFDAYDKGEKTIGDYTVNMPAGSEQ